jgi:hypothetical protein
MTPGTLGRSKRASAVNTGMEVAIATGRIKFEGPTLQPNGRHLVRITDTETGEQVDKVFTSEQRAVAWLTATSMGETPSEVDETEIPKVPDRGMWSQVLPAQQASPSNLAQASGRGRFSIRTVRAVLEDYGLDPTREIAEVLKQVVPVYDVKGNAVIGPDGQPVTKPLVSGPQRMQIFLELQQYVTPKLKAVEMMVKDDRATLTPEQVDTRILELLKAQEANRLKDRHS